MSLVTAEVCLAPLAEPSVVEGIPAVENVVGENGGMGSDGKENLGGSAEHVPKEDTDMGNAADQNGGEQPNGNAPSSEDHGAGGMPEGNTCSFDYFLSMQMRISN